ncbi:MFS general substrate transporter [Ceraceosorus guamensis]|uniref:MFS general substrate transporter n=1 Tax=Ceraceosorus guamensis TaxID=1522189 RepID=A0A316W626_9BASI|nr:MFS general substrate transporter [Ceraceosorus guamensis]PWN45212.1 MFS general substrate transporter [Ceraceosorus guamensis]
MSSRKASPLVEDAVTPVLPTQTSAIDEGSDLEHKSAALDTSADKQDVEELAKPVDLKEQRKAKNSDFFTVLASGAALISDGYSNNVTTMLNPLFTHRYGSRVFDSATSTRISNSLLVGAIIGQVVVGIICDRIGRKSAIVIATSLIVLGGIFATAASPVHGSTSALFWWITVARGALGVGVGAEYPASSTSASEAANERYGRKQRSTVFILVTNFVLSLGGPLAVSYFLIVLSASGYNNTTTPGDQRNLDIVWRLCYGFGAILPLPVFYFRMKILNSKAYRVGAIRRNVPYGLALKRYWPRLLGTCGAWFLYDFVAFSNGAFSGTIISTVVDNPTLKRVGEYQLLLGAIALPGALFGAFAVKPLGTKWLLCVGFTGYIIIGLSVGLAWERIISKPALFVVLYALIASFGNFGPGSCLGLVSSDSYPTALRGTFYGISAAVGKAGAAVGTEVFKPVTDNLGKKYVFIIAAGIGAAGVLFSALLIPDTTKFDLDSEDDRWRRYLLANGWNGELGDGSTPTHKASDVAALSDEDVSSEEGAVSKDDDVRR